MMPQMIWTLLMLPLLAAAGLGLAGRRAQAVAGYVTAVAVFASLILSIRVLLAVLANPAPMDFSWPWLRSAGGLSIPFGLLVDPLSALMLVIVSGVSLAVQIYSLGYMADDPGQSRYFAFMSVFTFSMLGLVLANNLIFLYIFWELVGLCSYLLIGFWYHKPEAADAAKKAFVVTRFGDLGFLIGILVVGYFLTTFNIAGLSAQAKAGQISQALATTIALLVFAGAVGKSAQFPLQVWLPDAMEGPTPVSALIHAATMVAAGVYLVARLNALFVTSQVALVVVAYTGAFTALLAATMACVEDDIKRILAYSTVSQLGLMMLAMGCGGFSAGMFHLTTHAAYKALLFLAAGSVIHALHTNSIWDMGGLWRKQGTTTAVLLIAALALAGVFPFSGFFSKEDVFMSVVAARRMDLLVAGLLTTLLTSFYIFRLFFVVFTGKPAKPEAVAAAHESPAVMTLPMLVLAVLAAGLGVYGQRYLAVLGTVFGPAPETNATTARALPFLASFMTLLGLAWAYIVYFQKAVSASLLTRQFKPLYVLVKNKYFIDDFYGLLVRQVMFVISRLMAWFDRNVVDGAVNGVAWLCRVTGQGLSRLQMGRVTTYLLLFVAGVVVIALISFFANPTVWAVVK